VSSRKGQRERTERVRGKWKIEESKQIKPEKVFVCNSSSSSSSSSSSGP
jgi:hypothetical protein